MAAAVDRKSKSGKMLVAAIDFGTTFSGYAFSFNNEYEKEPTKIAANTNWVAGTGGLISLKTPTILLLDKHKKFVAFGYEAEEKYSDLAASDEHKSYYYFRRFKMLLHNVSGRQLNRGVLIPDDKKQEVRALLVFTISIKYLKEHMLETLNKRVPDMYPNDILWVLTVPAIWSDGSKQFMREAAEMAGINKSNLVIALEPEAASLYCMHLPLNKMTMEGGTKSQKLSDSQISPFAKGTKYMVVDAGGGTVDITIHEVVDTDKLRELSCASGGAWGGTCVDAAFEKFLRKCLDDKDVKEDIFDKFVQECKEDWVDLFREFEIKKRTLKRAGSKDARPIETIKVPVQLGEVFKKHTGKNLKTFISGKKEFADKLTWIGDKMRVDADIFRSWFDESCNSTVKLVKEIFKQKSSAGTQTILLVGGFSESPILQEAIRSSFPDKRLIIPEDASLVVLRGAVIFGHNPVTIVSRIAKCSYGIRVYRDFQKDVHPNNKKVNIGGKLKCKDVFAQHVNKGQELVAYEAQSKQRYTPVEADQESLIFDVYTSGEEDPQYVTDIGCAHVGQVEVEVPDLSGGKERGVWVCMIFGGTELVVEAREEKTKKLTKANFDFLLG